MRAGTAKCRDVVCRMRRGAAMTIIIGLLGPAGAGKSSVAKYLAEKRGAQTYSLARPLKEIARRALQFSEEQLYGTQAQKEAIDPRYGFSCRTFLQKLGTEGCRAVLGDDVWTRACLRQITIDGPAIAVIDDVRFVNEADAIHRFRGTPDGDLSGFVWRLSPPEDHEAQMRASGAGGSGPGAHASETEWRTAIADVEIRPRQRGLDELFALVDAAMSVAVSC